jgi:hypothetical protein
MRKRSQQFTSVLAAVFLVVLAISMGAQVAKAQDANLQTRIEQYKKDRGTNPRENVRTLQARCVIAQATLKNLQPHVASVQKTRGDAYKNISDLLSSLHDKLDNQAFNTTTLMSVMDVYNGKVTEYTTNLNAYKQALDDSVNVDCVKDPYGFKAALDTARMYHDRLVPNITDIRSYVTNTIKPSLENVKTTLESGDTTGSNQQ